MDYSPPGFTVHGILQARILEWVAISFSRGSSWPRDQTWVSCIIDGFFTFWAIREALVKQNIAQGRKFFLMHEILKWMIVYCKGFGGVEFCKGYSVQPCFWWSHPGSVQKSHGGISTRGQTTEEALPAWGKYRQGASLSPGLPEVTLRLPRLTNIPTHPPQIQIIPFWWHMTLCEVMYVIYCYIINYPPNLTA